MLDVIDEDPNRPPLGTLRRAIIVVVERISAEPGWAQIVFTNHVGNEVLEQRRTATLHQATAVLITAAQPYLKPDADEMGLRMDTLVGIGGFVELIIAWRAGFVGVEPAQIIDHASRLGATLAAAYLTIIDDREPDERSG